MIRVWFHQHRQYYNIFKRVFLKTSVSSIVHHYPEGFRTVMGTQQEVMSPREAAAYIAGKSKNVTVSSAGIKKTAEHLMELVKKDDPVLLLQRWNTHALNVQTKDKAAVDWVFLTDVGNFSFWSDDENKKYSVTYKGKAYTGYWSWVAAINRALDEGIPLTDPAYYHDLTMDKLKQLLRSDSETEIPMLEERLQVLKEAGKILCEKYDGTFLTMLKEAKNSAQELLQLVTENIPSFRDMSEYKGQKVAIYKRAQILIADIWAACHGEGYGRFDDIDSLTMFADYRIPQALVWFGALEYSDELMDKLKEDNTLENGEELEVEIRGGSIHVTELIVKEVKKMMEADPSISSSVVMNAVLIDHYLWDYRREHAEETAKIPFHKTRCIYY